MFAFLDSTENVSCKFRRGTRGREQVESRWRQMRNCCAFGGSPARYSGIGLSRSYRHSHLAFHPEQELTMRQMTLRLGQRLADLNDGAGAMPPDPIRLPLQEF